MGNKSFYCVLICFIIMMISLVGNVCLSDPSNNKHETTNINTTIVTESISHSETTVLQNNCSVDTESETGITYMEPTTEILKGESITEQATEPITELIAEPEPLDPYTLTLDKIENVQYYHDIPLTHEQQDITMNIANEYNLPVDLLYAIMRVETHYTVDLISATDDYGIMQINACNHEMMTNRLGVTDFLDFEQNVRCGAYMLHLCQNYSETLPQLLMCYNRGVGGARKAWKSGETFDYYCEKVITELLKLQTMRHAN